LTEQSIPLIEALSITVSIEQSLIESRFFEVFETDSAELKNTLMEIDDDTLKHREKANKELQKHKKNQ